MLLLSMVNHRIATAIRCVGLALIVWTVAASSHPPSGSGRGLVIAVTLAACAVAWLAWTVRPTADGITPDLYVLVVAGGVLTGASPNGAPSAFVFVAVVVAGVRVEMVRVLPLIGLAVLATGISTLAYHGHGLGLLAYALGFLATALAASNGRQIRARAEQAELLLAQTQRSHEEQLRAARLEESTRLAREIHDVLAHTLAGLAIQLEATASLVEHGADRDAVLGRVRRAHALARQGLEETRQAVGALRGESVAASGRLAALVDEFRAVADAPAELTVDGDPGRLTGPTGQAVVRVVQEALTNVRKHAPGAAVSVSVRAGGDPSEDVVVVVADRPPAGAAVPAAHGLADTGGGYGLQGMRERAQLLGGTLTAGPTGDGWRVELRLPPPAGEPAAAGAAGGSAAAAGGPAAAAGERA